jgi:hypothetical protein
MTDPLDRATEALRNAPTPPGPPPELAAATVAALDASFTHRRNRMRLVRAIGATAALAAAVTIAVVLGTGSPASALDAAVAKARNARSVKFVSTMVVHHKEFQPKVSTIYYQGAKMRVEEAGHVRIADYATNRAIFLYPEEKYAWRVKNTQKFDPPLDRFNKFVNSRGRKEGADDVGGVKADRYHLKLDAKADPRDYRLWVDPRTGWPVKVEGKGKVDMSGLFPNEPWPDYTLTDDRFEWDAPLDEKLFGLDVPPGWELGDGPPELRPRKK